MTTPAEQMLRNSLVLHSLQDFMHAEAMHKVALEVVAFTLTLTRTLTLTLTLNPNPNPEP